MLIIENVESFTTLMKTETRPIIIDFFADWCGPCKKIAPHFEDLSGIYKKILFAKIDIDENEEVAGFLGVTSLPTFILFKNGKEVSRMMGASISGLNSLVAKGME